MWMADEKKFHVGVKAMIENAAGEILLMQEDVSNHSIPTDEYWDFPGGRMQEGESLIDTLRREVEEETGIPDIFEPSFVTAVISNHQIKLKSGEIVGLVLMVYRVTVPTDAEIILSDEHLSYAWIKRDKAKKLLTHKYPQEFTSAL
jgi:8-oxo-dGTP pyrophosphatase MutT (NUDIX family)